MSKPNQLSELITGLKDLSASLKKAAAEKKAFIPMPPDMPQQPMDPAAAQQMQAQPGGQPMPPPMDPAMAGGAGQPQQIDPAAMQQQAMAQAGGMPPAPGGAAPTPGAPPEQPDHGEVMEQIITALQTALDTMTEISARQDQLEQQMTQLAEQNQTLADSLAQPSPMDGAVQGAMGDTGGMPPDGGMGADGGQPMQPQGQPMM